MSRVQRRAWLLVAAIGLVGALGMAVARFAGKTRTRFLYAEGALAPHDYAALADTPGWSTSAVEVSPGIRLNGLIRRPRAASAPWIYFLTGNDATPLATAKRLLERVRGDDDWGAAVYAYRGFDSSGGRPERDLIADDMELVLQRLIAKEQLSAARVHVVAFSLGAYFAAKLAGTPKDMRVPFSTLSLLAPAESIVMVRRSWWSRWVPGDVIEMAPLLAAVPGPVLVVQGREDTTTGVEQGRAVAAALGARATYVELPGVTHHDLLESEAALSAVHRTIAEARPR